MAAYLVKLHESKTYMFDLRLFLVEHPALVWLLGFKLEPNPSPPYGFDPDVSLPGREQFMRVLRELDNAALQFLLDGTVQLIRDQLPAHLHLGDEVSMDTKHLMPWVKENNPKTYTKESGRPATLTANWAANVSATKTPNPNQPNPKAKRATGPPTSPGWTSITGAMLPYCRHQGPRLRRIRPGQTDPDL